MHRSTLHVLLAAVFVVMAGAARAVDSGPADDTLTSARARIKEKNWPAAIAELRRVNESGSADWNNLMGYAMRKQATPDYAAAERYYNEALRIDPRHKGALEYSGELSLINGDLPKAEERLATLNKVCRMSCEEYRDLKRAVDRYKANGNKYVPAP